MGFIDCIVKSKLADKAKINELEQEVKSLTESGMHPLEAERTVKNKFIKEYHNSLNDELNTLKKSLGLKESKLAAEKEVDTKEIDQKYQEKLSELEQQQIPPEPPISEPKEQPKEEGGGKKKGILNRLNDAKNVPQEAKKGFQKEGLEYKPKSQDEAAKIAKSIVEEFGVDEAVRMAKSMEFDGDVNSLIFAESLNTLKEQEDAAKTDEEKLEIAKRFAEVGIDYDKMARYGGRFNSAINYFYQKSPLGIVLMENANRKKAFDEWSKPKEKSWEEGFDSLMKDPEFKKVFDEKVSEQSKEERKQARKAKKEKIHKAIDETMAKWAKKFSANLPEGTKKAGASIDVFKAAATAMKAAYDAGEAITKVVQDAIDYITKETGVTDWDKEEFRAEWSKKLTESGSKIITDEDLKSKYIERLKKKLNGLTDKQKNEVIRRAFSKAIQNDALKYDDLRQIIQDVVGRGELTEEEQIKLKELVKKANAVDEAGKAVREERTDESLKKFREAEIEAGKASRELNEILWNKPDVVKRLTSIMQLNTLGIPALINNPIYNMWNQATLRFPIGIINDLIDRGISGAAKLVGKKYDREYNIWGTQREFFKKLGFGSRESVQQLLTGLNRMDYIQKEVYGQQIRPGRAMRDLYAFATGKKNLTQAQIIDKALQATVGVPAEAVARMLNIGDKPQRFAAEGAQAAAFAKALGLKGMDYKLFIEFPREEAYRVYKEQGLSDAEAGKKADYVKDSIIKEGERSTFQQDNLLNKAITAAFSVFGGKDSGYASLAKTLTVSPFIKIPSNAFWSYYNLVNPEVAMLQSMVHAGRSVALKGKEDNSSKLAMREARYWFAHAVTGMAMRAVVIAMVQAGVFRPSNDEDDTKKEREGEANYEPQGTVNLDKLSAWLRGDDPTKVKGGLLVQNRWFGQWGTVGNSIAKKWQDATPEQRENQDEFWNIVFGGMEKDALKEMGNGVFANTSALLSAIDSNGSFGFEQYGLNTMGLITNILHPATFAQMSRASLNEATTNRADTFMGQLKNAMLARSSVLRKLTGQYPETKVGIWGDPIKKQGNWMQRLFGITPTDKNAFARPIYDDAVRTNDIGYFPPAVQSKIGDVKLNQEQFNKYQEYVGKARKSYIAPFVDDKATLAGFNVTYSQLSDEDKKYVLQYMYGLGSDEGKKKLLEDYPELDVKEEPVDFKTELQRDLFKILQKYKK